MKRQHGPEKEGEEPPRCNMSSRTLVAVKSGGSHDGTIMTRAVFSDGKRFRISCTPAHFITSAISNYDEAEASSGNSTPSPSNLPLVYATIGCANSKRMRSSHKMENERGAGKGSKLWDQLPLTLKQEDIAWFVRTSLIEDDLDFLEEVEGRCADEEGDDEGDV
jgi:hypothetical protein